MSRRTTLIFNQVKMNKRHISRRRRSVFVKVLLITMFLNGILIHPNKFLLYFLAIVYHIAWGLSVTKSVTCLITNNHLIDLYSANLIALILAIILWWILFIRRNKIYKFILRLSVKQIDSTLKVQILIIFFTAILFPSVFLYIDMIHRAIVDDEGNLGPRPCRYFMMSKNTDEKIFFLSIDIIRPYISYSIFFLTFQEFFICGFLTWRYVEQTESRINSEDISRVLPVLKSTVMTVKELEDAMSLPVIFLLCKIAVDTFNGVSALCSGEKAEYARFTFLLTGPEESAWLLLIAVLGDSIQKQCLNVMNVSFARLRSSSSGIGLNYLDYKNMKGSTVLTAGSVFRINRGLLLKALTSAITYAVIISQFKNNNGL